MNNNIHSYKLAKNINCGKKIFSMEWGFYFVFGDTLKASIILVNLIIISFNVSRYLLTLLELYIIVISGHVRSIHVKWYMCLHHVPLVAQVAQ